MQKTKNKNDMLTNAEYRMYTDILQCTCYAYLTSWCVVLCMLSCMIVVEVRRGCD